MNYTEQDLLRLAKRHHNTKRAYLLVDPLQGKHLPASPSQALAMMRALGKKMAAQRPEIDVVIGFAETATAVAATAAIGMGRRCRYIHTTRESDVPGRFLEFREEHSHAVEQRLCLERLEAWIDGASGVALVDDELSTGRTMVNAIDALRAACPALVMKPVTAVSIISRLSDAREAALAAWGVRCLSLLRLPGGNYAEAVRAFEIAEAVLPAGDGAGYREIWFPGAGDMRAGVVLPDWEAATAAALGAVASALESRLAGKCVTVLGTEEYMLPALMLGERLEPVARSVRCHATTRSPIGVCDREDYPIRRGWRLRSFYEAARTSYIYNLTPCDAALIVTDSGNDDAVCDAMRDLTAALAEAGCREVILIREERHVRHL